MLSDLLMKQRVPRHMVVAAAAAAALHRRRRHLVVASGGGGELRRHRAGQYGRAAGRADRRQVPDAGFRHEPRGGQRHDVSAAGSVYGPFDEWNCPCSQIHDLTDLTRQMFCTA